MNYQILYNTILFKSAEEAVKIFEKYDKEVGFSSFAEQNRIINALNEKVSIMQRIKPEAKDEIFVSFALMIKGNEILANTALENIYNVPPPVLIETLGHLEKNEISAILDRFYNKFETLLLGMFLVNLDEIEQVKFIDKCKDYIDPKDKSYNNIYLALSNASRKKLDSLFDNQIEYRILLELQNVKEEQIIEKMKENYDELIKYQVDDLIELILLKATNSRTLDEFANLFFDKLIESSNSIFGLFIGRYRCFVARDFVSINDIQIFIKFRNKFHDMGIRQTIFTFTNASFDSEFVEFVILEFLDIAFEDIKYDDYLNPTEINYIMDGFVENCENKTYSIDQLKILVDNIKEDNKSKLIHDDFIEPVIALRKLLQADKIYDKDPLYISLRDKFINDLYKRCKRDGTCMELVNFNRLFYRVVKGNIPFKIVYSIKTYKGLIYLSKSGEPRVYSDAITKYLTDEQVVKLDIRKALRWKKALKRTDTTLDSNYLVEKMSLQLLLYFGEHKGKYLMNANIEGSTMEYLFDLLDYKSITVNDNGMPNINKELLDYLFGKGKLTEKNSVINRMIRGETPKLEKCFTEFCNNYYTVKEDLKGIFSVKRIINYYNKKTLSIELKPDELPFENALFEINSSDPDVLWDAIELLKISQERTYSTIPKVKGSIGDFAYEILDLNDPDIITPGYLSHCCFVVHGESHSALEHSMKSINGRTFMVYYKGRFLVQSWIWRNGDVVCFDSVEAGSSYHGAYNDNINLLSVYKTVAREIFDISKEMESEEERIKLITVGNSDYRFNKNELEELTIETPRPLEKDVYVYDSNVQHVLYGEVPKKVRYGKVHIKYKDPKKTFIVNENNVDLLDEALINVNAIRYKLDSNCELLTIDNVKKIISGNGFYIVCMKDNHYEFGSLNKNQELIDEYNKYLKTLNIDPTDDQDTYQCNPILLKSKGKNYKI